MNERFSIGTVMGTGFRVWGTNLVPFAILTALVYAPVVVWGVIVANDPTPKGVHDFQTYRLVLEGFLGIVASAALTYGVIMELQGRRASMGACIATGLLRFFPVLGVGILTMLCVALGFLLLLVPGIIVMCMLYVATQASVIERPGLVGALKRSKMLTENHRLEIFAITMLMGVIGGVIQFPLEYAAKAGAIGRSTFVFALLAVAIVLGSLGSVMNAVVYYYLRQEKEGTSAAELAKVFE